MLFIEKLLFGKAFGVGIYICRTVHLSICLSIYKFECLKYDCKIIDIKSPLSFLSIYLSVYCCWIVLLCSYSPPHATNNDSIDLEMVFMGTMTSTGIFVLLCLSLSHPLLAEDPTIYVAVYGDDVEGTGTATDPFQTIQRALESATALNTTLQVTVILDGGQYPKQGNSNLAYDGSISIVGSTAGTTSIDLNGAEYFFQGQAMGTDSVWLFELSYMTLGNASTCALSLTDYFSATIIGCTFAHNGATTSTPTTSGGALNFVTTLNFGGRVHIENSTFNNNTGLYGGAVYVNYPSSESTQVVNSAFIGNKAGKHGGAVRMVETGISFAGSNTFSGNIASGGNGGALSLSGSEVSAFGYFSADMTFVDNRASDSGGAIFAEYGDLTFASSHPLLFQNNSAATGGALSIQHGSLQRAPGTTLATLEGNSATVGGGGAIRLAYSDAGGSIWSQASFINNIALSGAGQVLIDEGVPELALVECTFQQGLEAEQDISVATDAALYIGMSCVKEEGGASALMPSFIANEKAEITVGFYSPDDCPDSVVAFGDRSTLSSDASLLLRSSARILKNTVFNWEGGNVSKSRANYTIAGETELEVYGTLLLSPPSPRPPAPPSRVLNGLKTSVYSKGAFLLQPSQSVLVESGDIHVYGGGELSLEKSATITGHVNMYGTIYSNGGSIQQLADDSDPMFPTTPFFSPTAQLVVNTSGTAVPLNLGRDACFDGSLSGYLYHDQGDGGRYGLIHYLNAIDDPQCRFRSSTMRGESTDLLEDMELEYSPDMLYAVHYGKKESNEAAIIISIILGVIVVIVVATLIVYRYWGKKRRSGPDDEYLVNPFESVSVYLVKSVVIALLYNYSMKC